MSSDKQQTDLTIALGKTVMKAHLKQRGHDPQSAHRPHVGIVNTSSGLAVCYAHLDEISALVAAAVKAAGGLATEVRTSGPTDGLFFVLGGRKEVPSARDVLAKDVEMMARGENLDGLIFLSSCDSTTPGHLLAAARLNLPAIVVPCGFQAGGSHCGRRVAIMDLYEGVGAVAAKRLSTEELSEMAEVAITSPGVCAGLGTANTMHMVAEALGLALPGTSPIWAGSERLRQIAGEAGRHILGLIEKGPRPAEILTESALRNAAAVVLASGGAATAVHHLQALADQLGFSMDMHAVFDELGDHVKQSRFISPAGPGAMEDLESSGGTLAIMKSIEAHLQRDAMTISGPLSDVLHGFSPSADAPLPVDDADAALPGLVVLHGSLAPEGAVVRPGIAQAGMGIFEGPATVFQNPQALFDSMSSGRLASGSVAVVLGSIDDMACLVTGAGLGEDVAIVSNGGFSGLSRGLVVGFMKSAQTSDHPIFQVRDGDRIRIDVANRSLDWERGPMNQNPERRAASAASGAGSMAQGSGI
ncbi:dihydroxy-acid dehydratase domain-containing protein [Castellaniella sp. S9]|uniref:dihydroxy-acid dehydratase domain-containing protein n=1 Tax=Castellaniella sp. S9 TaxID=2993652 RepID=UPI0022B43AF0|nr:dihydroxy-acid dehydratase [Castellaniella sp. S9]